MPTFNSSAGNLKFPGGTLKFAWASFRKKMTLIRRERDSYVSLEPKGKLHSNLYFGDLLHLLDHVVDGVHPELAGHQFQADVLLIVLNL